MTLHQQQLLNFYFKDYKMDHDTVVKNMLKNCPTFKDYYQKSCSCSDCTDYVDCKNCSDCSDCSDYVSTAELDSDIEHLEEVLQGGFKGCKECRKDHERLLSYMKELKWYRENSSESYPDCE